MSNELGKFFFASYLEDFLEDALEQFRMGVSFTDYLRARETMITQADDLNAKLRAPLAQVYADMRQRLEKGASFSKAIKGYVPPFCQMMIESSESIGKVEKGLEAALSAYRNVEKIKQVIIENSLMPLVLLLTGFGLIFMFGGFIIPQFKGVLEVKDLGWFLRQAYAFTNFTKNYAIIIVPLLISGLVFTVWSLGSLSGPVRRYLNILPPWNIYLLYSSSYVLIVLSTMVRNNIRIDEALRLIGDAASPFIASHIDAMRMAIKRGTIPAEALDTGLFPLRTIERLRLYQRNNKFDEFLAEMGTTQIEKAIKTIEKGVKSATAIFKIFFAVLIVGIILNTYGIQDALRANLYK